MAKFCPKCGKSLKLGIEFCAGCGAKIGTGMKPKPRIQQSVPVPEPVVPSSPQPAVVVPPPPPRRAGGCGVGCAVGCLIVVLVFLLIIGSLIGFGWYFLSKMKKGGQPGDYFDIDPKSKKEKTIDCEDSLSCLETNLKKCKPAQGETELGELALAEFEVLGLAEASNSCVVYAKIKEIQELPEGLNLIPNFILEILLKDLSFECLIPQDVYQGGVEEVGEYIGENLVEVCEGPLLDLAEKWGVDLEDIGD